MVSIKHRYTGTEYKTVTKYVVNVNDILHLDNYYLLLHEWLVEHGYASRNDPDFPEKYYLHREGPAGKELWIRWRPKKNPLENKLWRFDIDIDIHVLTLKDVEAVIGGKKYKAHKGEVETQVAANLVIDPEKTLEKSMFKDVKKLLYKKTWKTQREMLESQLYQEAMQLRDAINTFLKIDTYLPTKEWAGFWPKRVPE